jgi:hypothetical protein
MNLDIGNELARLERLSVPELQDKFAQVYGDRTRTGHKVWLVKRIAWRLQVLAEGDLSERARRRAAELASDADLRVLPPRPAKPGGDDERTDTPFQQDERLPPPGSVITRQYKGRKHQVRILAHGFEYAGGIYRSLSAVAKAITGSHCNGFLFFRIAGKGDAR